jgi:hypothetical protein
VRAAAFYRIGWDKPAAALTQKELDKLDVTDAELISIRLYTGPCFMLYNTVLRALGNPEQPGVVTMGCGWDANRQWGGQDVCGRFVTTLHTINHGVIKLSWLSNAIQVHRGLAGMKLPEVCRCCLRKLMNIDRLPTVDNNVAGPGATAGVHPAGRDRSARGRGVWLHEHDCRRGRRAGLLERPEQAAPAALRLHREHVGDVPRRCATPSLALGCAVM